MFGSNVLEVGIGLVLSYLLITLMLTSVVELIEAWRKRRARGLEVAIAELLDDREPRLDEAGNPVEEVGLRVRLYRHPLIYSLYCGEYGSRTFESAAPRAWWSRRNLPAYIPRDTFATALVDLMDPNSPNGASGSASPNFIQAWDVLLRLTSGDAEKMRAEIAFWYDAAMERAASRYKRRTQKQLFWLGLVAALAFNINSVVIARVLNARTPAARSAMLEAARVVVATNPSFAEGGLQTDRTEATSATQSARVKPTDSANLQVAPQIGLTEEVRKTDSAPSEAKTKDQEVKPLPDPSGKTTTKEADKIGKSYQAALAAALEEAELPIGWEGQALVATRQLVQGRPATKDSAGHKASPSDGKKGAPAGETKTKASSNFESLRRLAGWLMLIAGYLLTGLAATLGSPFWFDMLNRFVNIRSAMKPAK